MLRQLTIFFFRWEESPCKPKKISLHVNGSGVVTSTGQEHICFLIPGSQYVTGVERPSDVVVCCWMDQNAKWNKPLLHVPTPNTVVAFERVLQNFEDYTPPDSTHTLQCAIVALDDITYICKGGLSANSPKLKDSVHKKFHMCVQKFQQQSPSHTATAASFVSAPQDSPSRKRKVEGSADEVEDEVEAGGDDWIIIVLYYNCICSTTQCLHSLPCSANIAPLLLSNGVVDFMMNDPYLFCI